MNLRGFYILKKHNNNPEIKAYGLLVGGASREYEFNKIKVIYLMSESGFLILVVNGA